MECHPCSLLKANRGDRRPSGNLLACSSNDGRSQHRAAAVRTAAEPATPLRTARRCPTRRRRGRRPDRRTCRPASRWAPSSAPWPHRTGEAPPGSRCPRRRTRPRTRRRRSSRPGAAGTRPAPAPRRTRGSATPTAWPAPGRGERPGSPRAVRLLLK